MPTMNRIRQVVTPKRVTLLAVTAVVLALVFGAMRPEPTDVETARARRGPLHVTVDAEGITRVRDRFVIAAPVAGRLLRLAVRAGDAVDAGDVVASLAPVPLDAPAARQARARLDAARAYAREATTRVRNAEAAASQSVRDARRAVRLHEAGALSDRALEEAELLARTGADDVAAARAHGAAAAADVEQAAAALLHAGGGSGGMVTVRAPAGGRVLRLAEPSERVIAQGTAIAELGDTRALEVVVDVLSSDAARVRDGMPVVLEGWGSEVPVVGCVRLVEPAARTRVSALGVEEQRVYVIVDVEEPPPSIGDGFRVDARIEVWASDSALTIPASALVRVGREWAVFTIASGRAVQRTIAVGRMGGGAAQLLGGLAEGEEVIVFPSDAVRDGTRVRARIAEGGNR